MATFLQLFEKHQGKILFSIKFKFISSLGLAHFEALELLSNQSSIVLQTMSRGNEEILEQIDDYFQINDDDSIAFAVRVGIHDYPIVRRAEDRFYLRGSRRQGYD